MSNIAAGTSSGTALVSTGDTTGQLILQTNGTTTAVTIGTNQVVTLAQPLPVASGGTGGSATPTAGGVVYGTGTVQAVTAAGTSGQLLQSNAASAPTWVTFSAGFTLATPVASTSGSSITFTGIPSGTKQVIFMLNEVSTGGSDPLQIRIGDSGGIETTGYEAFACSMSGGSTTQIGSSAGAYQIESALPAVSGYTRSGNIVINLENNSNNTWVLSGTIKGSGPYVSVSAGRKSLSAVLDRISILAGGGNSFSAGEVNIAYI